MNFIFCETESPGAVMHRDRAPVVLLGVISLLVVMTVMIGLALNEPARFFWLQVYLLVLASSCAILVSVRFGRITLMELDSVLVFSSRFGIWLVMLIIISAIIRSDRLQLSLELLEGVEASIAEASFHMLVIFASFVYVFGSFQCVSLTMRLLRQRRQFCLSTKKPDEK